MMFATGRVNYTLHSFSLGIGFIPMGFPGKIFNEAANKAYNKICVLFFPSLKFFSTRFFLSKVLTRYIIINGHPRGSVVNLFCGLIDDHNSLVDSLLYE